MSSSRRRSLGQNLSASANKLRFNPINKILKIDHSKGNKKEKRDVLGKQISRIALVELLKDTSEKSFSNSCDRLPDFKTFLSDKENIKEFREFLKTQYCQENIDFYLACEKYRNLNPDRVGKEMIKFMATQIYNDYLGQNARQPVNINHDCVQKVLKQMPDPKPDLLIEPQMEIFHLMKTDCYPRFCKTWGLERATADRILNDDRRLAAETGSGTTTATSHNNNTTINSLASTTTRTTSSRAITTSLNRTNDKTNAMIMPSSSGSSQDSISLASSSGASTCSSSVTSSSRGTRRKSIVRSNIECPPDCPYYRVGLPCQRHVVRASQPVPRAQMDLADSIDLRKLHHVPSSIVRRSPPPPPLPPKPERILRPPSQPPRMDSPVINKKHCPYVGKVFHV